LVIFDCNGVLVDSEPIAAAALSEALGRVGVALSTAGAMRRFHGRRPADVFTAIEAATGRRLPSDFSAYVAAETLRRLRTERRPIAHAAHALTWIRGPKAVASSSPPERIRTSLEVTGLMRFFESRWFSASAVRKGKPAPDLFLLAAARSQIEPGDCIVVEDSGPGIAAAAAAGMKPIGFVGGSHTPGKLAAELLATGACTIVADLRALKSAIADLRGW
jgi:HAD superfamily hydrolase (TIGR01509 family)